MLDKLEACVLLGLLHLGVMIFFLSPAGGGFLILCLFSGQVCDIGEG